MFLDKFSDVLPLQFQCFLKINQLWFGILRFERAESAHKELCSPCGVEPEETRAGVRAEAGKCYSSKP